MCGFGECFMRVSTLVNSDFARENDQQKGFHAAKTIAVIRSAVCEITAIQGITSDARQSLVDQNSAWNLRAKIETGPRSAL